MLFMNFSLRCCGPCYSRLIFLQTFPRVDPARRLAHLKSWKSETHYTTLGVETDATQEQIRNAYLKLSKEFHPDHHAGLSLEDTEAIHNKFVKINAAYSVLGNKKDRRIYDLEVLMREDPRWRGKGEEGEQGAHIFNTRPMTFEERARAMGFKPQDPDFYKKHGNYHHKVVVGCLIFICFGIVFQGLAIRSLYNRHSAELNLATMRNTAVLMNARANARQYSSVHEQWASLQPEPPVLQPVSKTEPMSEA